MLLHTDHLFEPLLRYLIASVPGCEAYRLKRTGSKTHADKFDVILSGSGNVGGQYGSLGSERGATWDEYGIFLARAFAVDPDMRVDRYYLNAKHFHWATDDRYIGLDPADQCRKHKWSRAYDGPGDYYVSECIKECGALIQRGHSKAWEIERFAPLTHALAQLDAA